MYSFNAICYRNTAIKRINVQPQKDSLLLALSGHSAPLITTTRDIFSLKVGWV
jgi:hypothetical protein